MPSEYRLQSHQPAKHPVKLSSESAQESGALTVTRLLSILHEVLAQFPDAQSAVLARFSEAADKEEA